MTKDKLPISLDLKAVDPLPDAIEKYFAVCAEKLGLTPNVLKAYSFDIEKLKAFTGLYNNLMLAGSGLSKLEREMIAVVVSSINQCFYCLTAHGAAVRGISGDPVLGEQLVMNWRTAELEPRQSSMLEFSEKVALESHKITEGDRAEVRKAGFSDRDIWDIAAVASFFAMTNRMASAVDMQPNTEYHAAHRS